MTTHCSSTNLRNNLETGFIWKWNYIIFFIICWKITSMLWSPTSTGTKDIVYLLLGSFSPTVSSAETCKRINNLINLTLTKVINYMTRYKIPERRQVVGLDLKLRRAVTSESQRWMCTHRPLTLCRGTPLSRRQLPAQALTRDKQTDCLEV